MAEEHWILLQIAIPIVFVFGVMLTIGLSGGINNVFLGPLEKRFDGLDVRTWRNPGDVHIVYHSYRGLLLWFVQTEHSVYAPPTDARILLGRLLRFNLTCGMLSYGMVFVPLVSFVEYFQERRSIGKQERELAQSEVRATEE